MLTSCAFATLCIVLFEAGFYWVTVNDFRKDKKSKGQILAPNHIAIWDPVYLHYYCGISPAAKADLFQVIIRVAGVCPTVLLVVSIEHTRSSLIVVVYLFTDLSVMKVVYLFTDRPFAHNFSVFRSRSWALCCEVPSKPFLSNALQRRAGRDLTSAQPTPGDERDSEYAFACFVCCVWQNRVH